MLYANAKKRQFIPTPGNNEAQAVSLRPILIYGTKLYLDILFCDDDGEPLEFSESDTFECAGDNNFTHSDDLMFYSGPERCFLTEVPGVLRFEIYTNTTAFKTKAGEKATQSTIHFQVRRYLAGETLPDTILQDTFYALGSVMGLDDKAPESADPEYYTSAQIRALLNAGYEMEFSADGESWHAGQADGDLYYHYRNRQIGGEWSDKIMIPKGEQGDPAPELKTQYSVDGSTLWHDEYAEGDAYMRTSSDNGESWSGAIRILGQQGTAGSSSYTYVAYASDASGSGFSLTPSDTLKYRAEIHSETAIESPDADDFSGAVWVKYIGSDGTSGTSAGFGAPDATAETLAAGSEATAEVTASGEDTAKVFHFSFGIPKGADGADGKSAYQLWLEQEGNEGKSLDDFFNAYRGADGTGLTVRGAYDPASTYQKTDTAMDAVQYNGSLWGYINATAGSGNAPPESAATVSNDYWTLLVAKGDPGENGVTPTIDPVTKNWKIGNADTGVCAEGKIEGGTATFSNVSEENIATLTGTSVPVGIRTNKGNYYPVEKGSVVIDVSGGTINLDVSPYLAYDNSASFSGTWTVYFAAGKQGEKGNNALSFQIGTVTTLSPGSDATVTATVSDEGLVTLNLGIPAGTPGTDGTISCSVVSEIPSDLSQYDDGHIFILE